ncbi:FecR family protein [Pseudomonas sp. MM211]|uniref:FecR family protein n=1 Tax=Pseudomonas sp. MM211 TaxID=2866808 RepID=UPI001CED3D7D|nr:FecR family protein [Pseudomonas sp. MM211]UCJ17008.1 FecR family protein [Pseudomonas sp. MM211]
MTDSPGNTDDLLEQAADWHLRLSETPDARTDFERWLTQSPEHRHAWQQIERVWGGIAQLRETPTQSARPASALQTRRKRRWLPAALAAGIAALAILTYPQAALHWQADYITAAGETRTVTLADGSQVTLGPRSALRSDYRSERRDLQLLAGQAFFDVQRDVDRPFVVQAGSSEVRVLGTAFEVDLGERYLEVAVQRGLVRVSSQLDGASSEDDLRPGEALRQNRLSGTLQHLRLDSERVAAWRHGQLFVENASVGEILEQMRRYTPGWIVLADPALAQRRLSGIYDMRDPDRALGALAQSLSVPSRRMTPWIRVLGTP